MTRTMRISGWWGGVASLLLSIAAAAAEEQPGAGAKAQRFRDRGDYVEDTQTGLLWQKDGAASGKKNFFEAAEYAKKLKLGGLTGWRVPTSQECAAIFPAHEAPFQNTAYNPNLCCGGEKEFRSYWTSELDTRLEDYAFVYQWYAKGGANNCFASKNFVYVRCVRGSVKAGELLTSESTGEPAAKLDEKTIARVKELVVQLGSERFALRERAAEELKSLGRLVEPLLRESLETATDAEARFRLKALLDEQ